MHRKQGKTPQFTSISAIKKNVKIDYTYLEKACVLVKQGQIIYNSN